MLCNYCGKSLEGRASVCSECSELHGRANPQSNQLAQEAPPSVATTYDHPDNLPHSDTRLPIEGSPRRGLRFHRFVAFMVDSTIMGIPLVLISGLVKSYLISPLLTPDPMAGGVSMMLMVAMPLIGAMLAFLAASILVPPIYYILMESGGWQATVGKRLLGLYVVNQNGSRCSPWEAGLRYFGRVLLPFVALLVGAIIALITAVLFKNGSTFIPLLIALAGVFIYLVVSWKIYISFLYSPTRQGLHDRLANCYVVARDNHPSYAMAALALIVALITSAMINALMPSAPSKQAPRQFPGITKDPFDLKGLEDLPQVNSPPQRDTQVYVPPVREPLPTPESYNPNPPPRQPIFAPIPVEPPVVIAPSIESRNQTPPVELEGTTVTFGRVDRELTSSVAFMNHSRTELRVYLGQRDFSPEEIARIEANTSDSIPIPRADMVLIASYPNPVESDCSLAKASTIQVALYRTGITGFPLPGRNPSLQIAPKVDTTSSQLNCGPSRGTRDKPRSQVTISGILRGKGTYAQGEAAWPVSWNVKVGG